MARISRQNLKSLYIHSMVQGINKEYIFSTEEMKKIYKQLLKENMQKSNLKLLSYCIMSNHSHMLMYVENFQEMSKLMQKVNTSFARIYNQKNNRVGFVFRNRFSVQQILNYQHLYNCLAYIHNNPVKAGIVKKAEDYKYSSYSEWVNQREIIDEKCNELIFGENQNYIEIFNKIHLNNEILDIEDIVETINYEEILTKYEKNKDKSIENIINDEKILQDIVFELKTRANLSLRQISSILKINRPKITKLLKTINIK